MDLEKARDLVKQLDAALAPDAPEQPPEQPPHSAGPIDTPGKLDAAIAAASAGDVLLISPLLVYTAPLVLSRSITLRSTETRTGRMTLGDVAPRFLGGIKVVGPGVELDGLEVRVEGDRTKTIIDVTGADATCDRNRVLGDPKKGQKRGIGANGANGRYFRNYVEDCHGPYPGDDCQAFFASNFTGSLTVEDNHLSGSTESLMIGGDDPIDEAHTPSDVVIRGNLITKKPEWQSQLVGVKNALEIKNCRRFVVEGNIILYSWGGHGQDGYLLMLTVRNQEGRAPWSTICDGQIMDNRFGHGAAAINILALDDIKEPPTKPGATPRPTPVGSIRPSVRMARVAIGGNIFDDLSPSKYTGSPKMIQIGGGPIDLSIEANQFIAANQNGLTSAVYFQSGPPAVNLNVRGNTWPRTKYGVFGTGATVGKAWAQYVKSGELSNNTEV